MTRAVHRKASHLLRRRASRDDGSTLLEVVVSFVLFAIVSAAAVAAVTNAIQASNVTRDRITATSIGQADLQQAEALREPSYPSTTGYPKSVSVGGETYTVNRLISSSSGSTCPTTLVAGTQSYLNLTVSVSWPGSNGRSVREDTVIAC